MPWTCFVNLCIRGGKVRSGRDKSVPPLLTSEMPHWELHRGAGVLPGLAGQGAVPRASWATSPWRQSGSVGSVAWQTLGCAEMGPGSKGRQTHHSLHAPLLSSLPSFYLLSMAPQGMEYNFGHLGSAVLALSLSTSWAPPAPSLMGRGEE